MRYHVQILMISGKFEAEFTTERPISRPNPYPNMPPQNTRFKAKMGDEGF
jgi:hypothetical protein